MQKTITYKLDCCLQYLYRQLHKEVMLAFIYILTCKRV